eukprot:scaffold14174_cov46-Cyclotella_meneghiniana.AAC.3
MASKAANAHGRTQKLSLYVITGAISELGLQTAQHLASLFSQHPTPLLNKNKEEKKFVQEVTGVFLYYARAVDSTMLVALSAIAAEQGAPTQNTLKKVNQFLLDYVVTHPEATVTYSTSDMKLETHSDASCPSLSEPKSWSRGCGHYFLPNGKINASTCPK